MDRTRLIIPPVFISYKMRKQLNSIRYISKRKSRLLQHLVAFFCICAVLFVIIFFGYRTIHKHLHGESSVLTLNDKWHRGKNPDYAGVYETSRLILQKNPLNLKALTYHGYASFYLAVSQLDTSLSQNYLDEAINSLRLATMRARKPLLPQLEYMLGKSYFYKNTVSSYYYSDLAIKYFLKSKKDGYKADDISEYLGLSYASLGMTMDSISAFTEALLVRESDSLLLSIAQQYYIAGQTAAAKQYLFRIISNSKNEELVLKSSTLLGNIYIDEQKYDEAEKEFTTILQKNENSADAYYGLGVIYEKQGDLVKARAEWRNTLRVQVNHPGALKKLADYK